jgi:hypothetical protein
MKLLPISNIRSYDTGVEKLQITSSRKLVTTHDHQSSLVYSYSYSNSDTSHFRIQSHFRLKDRNQKLEQRCQLGSTIVSKADLI